MDITKEALAGKNVRGVIRKLIDEVTKTEKEAKEKSTRGGKSPDLKLYVVDTSEKILGRLDDIVASIIESESSKKAAKNFFNNHIIEEYKLNSGIWWIEIKTPRYERTDDFIFVEKDNAIWILTTELKDWAKDTVENVIKYLPQMERVYLSSDDLEDVMGSIVDSEVSGFTAKYRSQYREKKATLRFHGAEPDDMKKAEEHFQATPTRIEFNQRNSPSTAIQGSGSNDGILTVESVRLGSEDKATDTLLGTSKDFTVADRKRYEVNTDSKIRFFGNGFSVDEFTSIELYGPERESAENLDEEIESEILSKNQYQYGRWGESTFFIHDKHHDEIFELGIESPELVLHARETTTALSLRGFCKNILDEFDSTYSLRKKETEVNHQ